MASQASESPGPYVIPLPERRPSLQHTVYIDLDDIRPENELANSRVNASSRSREFVLSAESSGQNDQAQGQNNQSYVEDTIFYDPFDDRRIDVAKEGPRRPNQLTLTSTSVRYQPSVHTNRQSPVYSSLPRINPVQTPPDDGFRLTPLPVADTPDPPPAYTEIDTRQERLAPPVPCNPGYHLPQPHGDQDRKLITCPFCRVRVYTLVVRESGAITHVMAVILFFFCLLFVFCIYCMDWCKYKNHYCPNCNNLIGYEIPFLCTDMVYSKKPSIVVIHDRSYRVV
ncbi:unnamed protein product [Colias eurytheme]|nr:unnamed protein product [Colias eurytheme]